MQRLLLSLSVAAAFASAPSAQVSLEFGGGNLNDYVGELRIAIEAQRQRYAGPAPDFVEFPNILVQGDAESFPIPELRLIDVTPDAALNLLKALRDPRDQSRVDVDTVQSGRPSRAGESVARGLVVVTVEGSRKQLGSDAPDRVRVEVLSVRDLIELPIGLGDLPESASLVIPIDELLVALDVGLGLIPGDVEPDIRFHAESGLLFVRGSPEHIRVTGDVIDRVELPLILRRRAAQELLARRSQGSPPASEPAAGSGGGGSRDR